MKNRFRALLQLLRDWWSVPIYRNCAWTNEDGAQLRAFLASPTGLRMCQMLDNKVQTLGWAAATDGKPHSCGVAMGVRLAHNFLGILAGKGQPSEIPAQADADTQPLPSSQPAGVDGLEHLTP